MPSVVFHPTDLKPSVFEIMARIHGIVYPDNPCSGPEMARHHESRVGAGPFHFELIETDRETVGYCSVKTNEWVREPGLLWIEVDMLPSESGKGIESTAVDRMETKAIEMGASKVATRIRSYCPAMIEAFERKGYTCIQRDLITVLNVDEFPLSQYRDLLSQLKANEIEIVSIGEMLREGQDWLEEAYHLNVTLMGDVEIAGGFAQRSFEAFRDDLMNPQECDPDLNFYARMHKKLVGETSLYPLEPSTHICLTGLTGVLTEYRRKRIATGLKVKVIEAAKARGIHQIFTGNERENPMYRLNLALGYRDNCEDLTYWKVLSY